MHIEYLIILVNFQGKESCFHPTRKHVGFSQHIYITLWSVLFDKEKKEASYFFREDFTKEYTFSL